MLKRGAALKVCIMHSLDLYYTFPENRIRSVDLPKWPKMAKIGFRGQNCPKLSKIGQNCPKPRIGGNPELARFAENRVFSANFPEIPEIRDSQHITHCEIAQKRPKYPGLGGVPRGRLGVPAPKRVLGGPSDRGPRNPQIRDFGVPKVPDVGITNLAKKSSKK